MLGGPPACRPINRLQRPRVPSAQQTTSREGVVRTRQMAQSSTILRINRLAISLACATLVSAGVFAAQPAYGQSASGTQVSSLEAEVRYDDQTLRAFAGAAAAVLALRGRYFPRIRAAEIADAKEKADLLYKEMLERMHRAISGAGFTDDQYRAISSAAKADERLRARINALLQAPSPAQQHIQNVARLNPTAPEVAAAPNDAAPVPEPVAPATPELTPAPTSNAAPPADPAVRQRLKSELSKANTERDRYRAEQAALQEKVKKLERQLSNVKAQDSALRQQLTEEKEKAQAQQKKTEGQLETRAAEVAVLKGELAAVQSRDSALREQLAAERARADAAQSSKESRLAAFREDIKLLADRLASAQQELDSLAGDLKPGDTTGNDRRLPAFEALTPLRSEPTSIEKVLERVQPQYAARQELNNQIAQIEEERVRREAERSALQQEIAELSRNLAATYQAMAELIGKPANAVVAAAEWDIDYETHTLDVSQETAELFQVAPPQFEQAFADRQAAAQIGEPDPLGFGDPVVEQGAAAPADSTALEPVDTAPLRINPAPIAQIATVSASPAHSALWEFDGVPAAPTEIAPEVAQPPHQIVRDDNAFQPSRQSVHQPEPPVATRTATSSASLRDGAAAYNAADYQRAYGIWAALAESGNRSAQFHLGALYFEGRGIDVDFAQSYFWLSVSAYQGDQRAAALLAMVAAKLTRDQISASDDQARQWLEQRSIGVTHFEPAGSNRL